MDRRARLKPAISEEHYGLIWVTCILEFMDRRQVLAGMTMGMASITGCTQLSNAIGAGGSKSLGESASCGGIDVTPAGYLTTSMVTLGFANHNKQISAQEGATHLLTYIKSAHNGESKQDFPANGLGEDTISLSNNGEFVSEGRNAASMAKNYIVSGVSLSSYDAVRSEKAMGGAYPGVEVNGWILNEIAANFDAGDLELSISCNGETMKWTYSEDAKTSIDAVRNNTNSTTITL